MAALRAARHGAAVTLVENDLIGGTCLNRGCIPTKALLASAEALARARAGEEYGFEVAGEMHARLRAHDGAQGRHRHPVAGERRGPAEEGGRQAWCAAPAGWPEPGAVTGRTAPGAAGGTVTVEADKIIIATGSEPARLPMFDFDHPCILTSTEALELQEIPDSLLIVGAGVIGCEFASFFAELGTQDHHGGDDAADAAR